MNEETISVWSIQNGWHTAPRPEPVPDKKPWDLLFEFGRLGYGQCLNIEDLRDGRYLAVVEHHYQNGSFTEVLLPDMPSVLEFLRLYGPIFQQARLLDMMEEVHDLLVNEEYGLLRETVWAKQQSREQRRTPTMPTSTQNNTLENPRG